MTQARITQPRYLVHADGRDVDSEHPLHIGTPSAFGETAVSQLTTVVDLQFPYHLHPDLVFERHNSGSASVANSVLTLSTGASANQSAQVLSHIPIKYYPGQGGLVRFTTIYTTGVANSTQLHGIGDSGDGYFFGYNGADFGILRRVGGNPEIRVLTVTTGSSHAENVTITLDGDSTATVAVTNTGDVTLTANEIGAHDYSNVGRGWQTHVKGDEVVFISYTSEPRTGSYSLSSATSAVGSFSRELAGVSPTDNWTAQSDWNKDKADGSGHLPVMDWTKGNVFQIRYQWLGFGRVTFFVEDPSDGEYNSVHAIEYANTTTTPSVYNPTLPLCMMVENTTNTSDMSIASSSMAGFIEGKQPKPPVKHVQVLSKTLTSTAFVPIITGHNNHSFQSKLNRVRMKIESISVAVDSGKDVVIEVVRNATLTGASFSAFDANTSVAFIDTTATAATGGEILDGFTVASGDSQFVNLEDFVEVNEFVTIEGAQASSGTNSIIKIVVNWTEDF